MKDKTGNKKNPGDTNNLKKTIHFKDMAAITNLLNEMGLTLNGELLSQLIWEMAIGRCESYRNCIKELYEEDPMVTPSAMLTIVETMEKDESMRFPENVSFAAIVRDAVGDVKWSECEYFKEDKKIKAFAPLASFYSTAADFLEMAMKSVNEGENNSLFIDAVSPAFRPILQDRSNYNTEVVNIFRHKKEWITADFAVTEGPGQALEVIQDCFSDQWMYAPIYDAIYYCIRVLGTCTWDEDTFRKRLREFCKNISELHPQCFLAHNH